MSGDPGQSFLSTAAEWLAGLAPLGYMAKWLFEKGRDGSQLTISGQAALLKTLQETVTSLTDRVDKLVEQLDERDHETQKMSERIRRLETQIMQLGATPVP